MNLALKAKRNANSINARSPDQGDTQDGEPLNGGGSRNDIAIDEGVDKNGTTLPMLTNRNGQM